MSSPRASGVLMHVTSLPGRFGIGDLGPAAFRFVDWMAAAGQQLWQVLPLVPTDDDHSPYASPSTFAGNPLLISPEALVDDGLLSPDDFVELPAADAGRIDYGTVVPLKRRLLERAYERFEAGHSVVTRPTVEAFHQQEAHWLDDYALFMALKESSGGTAWTDWPMPLRLREEAALDEARAEHARRIDRHRFWQYLFHRQWTALRRYSHRHGVRIFGDLPIYVALDSADVWANPDLFQLDEQGRPTVVAGVPPDYFSATGQRWGNPLYRWDRMRAGGYSWWKRRLEALFAQVDLVRLDHFRAFQAYWSVPAEAETAVDGEWIEGPGADFFEALEDHFGSPLPIVAEDLGLITEEVHTLMDAFALPGMAVMQFAFHERPDHAFLPHNHRPRLAAYTGTHDNDTLIGWWRSLEAEPRAFAARYVGVDEWADEREVAWAFVRSLWQSVAARTVVPAQDLLALGAEARMNVPGSDDGNWSWRLREGALTPALAERLRRLTHLYGRASDGADHRPLSEHAEA